MPHICPGELCENVVEDHLLACKGHWRQVPREVQERVLSAWRDLRDGKAGALAAYRKARDEAVSHMEPLNG